MKKKKRRAIGWIFLCCLVGLFGCTKQDIEKEKEFLIFIGEKGPQKQGYRVQSTKVEEQIDEILKELKEPKNSEYQSIFSKGVDVKRWELEEGKLTLFFSKVYEKQSVQEEVYLRSSLVLILTQLSGIEGIQFVVEEKGLKDEFGEEIGYMKAEDFLESSGLLLQTYHSSELVLYLPKESGDKLIVKRKKVHYNSGASFEKIILEEYMKEVLSNTTEEREIKILGVSVKDGICYINLDESFLKQEFQIQPRVIIYGIVNSIVEGGSVEKVQFAVGGDSNLKYREQIEFKNPLSPDWSLVEE